MLCLSFKARSFDRVKIEPVRALRIGNNVSPKLPPGSESDALPTAEDSIVIDVVDLPRVQLAVALQSPSAKTADARRISNSWISLNRYNVSGQILDAQNIEVEPICAVPE